MLIIVGVLVLALVVVVCIFIFTGAELPEAIENLLPEEVIEFLSRQ